MHAFLVSIEVTDLDLVVTVPLHRDTEMRVTCPSSQCDKEYLDVNSAFQVSFDSQLILGASLLGSLYMRWVASLEYRCALECRDAPPHSLLSQSHEAEY